MMNDTRSRLVSATRELLWERGYTGTSPKDIQTRAGVGQGSMYHHFSGKPELAAAAIGEAGTDLLASAEESLGEPGSALARIAGYLHRERPVLRGCPIGRLTEDAGVMDSDELRLPIEHTLQRLRSRIAELVEEGRQTGEFASSASPARIAATVVATVQGGYVLAKASGDESAFRDAVDGLLDLLTAQLTHQQS